MEFKINKYLPKSKEELPPINKSTRSASNQILKSHIESSKYFKLYNKIDPLVLVTQYEREINRIKVNHNQMLNDLYKEIEILRLKNRDLLDELIVMNGGNYCCKHLENLSREILQSNANDNQKSLSDILYNAKIYKISTEDNKINNIYNCKNELSELIDIGNKDIEDKSNLLLQDQLNKCNTIIEVLQQENMQQKAELNSLNSLLKNQLNITGDGFDRGLLRKNLNSNKKCLTKLPQSVISYLDIVSSK